MSATGGSYNSEFSLRSTFFPGPGSHRCTCLLGLLVQTTSINVMEIYLARGGCFIIGGIGLNMRRPLVRGLKMNPTVLCEVTALLTMNSSILTTPGIGYLCSDYRCILMLTMAKEDLLVEIASKALIEPNRQRISSLKESNITVFTFSIACS